MENRSTTALGIGSVVAGYELVRALGAGAMGEVFEGRAPDGTSAAIKFLRLGGHDHREMLLRFRREASVSSGLRHPNVVTVLDHGVHTGVPFLVMPLLRGGDLDRCLEKNGPLRPDVAVSIALEAAAGLRAAHEAGIVHRDFKPANVFLDERADGVSTIVCDFGVAKVFDPDGSLTSSGAVLGTPMYMAPEQLLDSKRVDARCDVWALGMTLYHALSGAPAFAHLNGLADFVMAMRDGRIPSLQSRAAWVPPALTRVVHGALLPIDRRFQSIAELADALRAWGPRAFRPNVSDLSPLGADEKLVQAISASLPVAAADLGSPEDATHASADGAVNDESELPDDVVGTTLGDRYRIGARIGAGGMGAVYEGVDLRAVAGAPDRDVAVKVMRPEGGKRGGESIRRFLREAKAAQKITSPHVATVLDVGVDDGAMFLVMERLRGHDLASVLQRCSALSPDVAVTLFLEACEGLAAAHAVGVVHRDIKPSNLFVHEASGRAIVKVCDFGIAKQLMAEGGEASTELTRSGGMLGSPLYMSPEQAKSAKSVDARSDMFSLALSLHEALSGTRPWQGRSSVGEIIVAVCTEDVPSLTASAPWIDPRLAAIVERALTRDVAGRFASIAELAAALRPFGLGRPVTPDDLAPLAGARRVVVHPTTLAAQLAKSDSGAVTAKPVSIDPTTTVRGRMPRATMAIAAALAMSAIGAAVYVRVRPPAQATSTVTSAPPALMPVVSAPPPPPSESAPSTAPSAAPASPMIVDASVASAPTPRAKPRPTASTTASSTPSAAASAPVRGSPVGRGVTATDLPPPP
jgi:serine/threonine protein kinase